MSLCTVISWLRGKTHRGSPQRPARRTLGSIGSTLDACMTDRARAVCAADRPAAGAMAAMELEVDARRWWWEQQQKAMDGARDESGTDVMRPTDRKVRDLNGKTVSESGSLISVTICTALVSGNWISMIQIQWISLFDTKYTVYIRIRSENSVWERKTIWICIHGIRSYPIRFHP
jgi:hypothetical protein